MPCDWTLAQPLDYERLSGEAKLNGVYMTMRRPLNTLDALPT